jgi:hypothetical protein
MNITNHTSQKLIFCGECGMWGPKPEPRQARTAREKRVAVDWKKPTKTLTLPTSKFRNLIGRHKSDRRLEK